MPTTLIPATLSLTADQVRTRLLGELGTIGLPAPHWPLTDLSTNDCLGFLTWAAGIRAPDDYTSALIRISAFRATAGWHEVGPADVRAGDWALCNWDANPDADHIEYVYSIDHAHGDITDVSANTGPRPGVDIKKHPELRGVYRKTRDIGPWLIGAIRPPYAVTTPTSADRKTVRADATYLNRTLPSTFHDTATGHTITLHRSGAGDIGKTPGDGIRGPIYRLLVQAWGATHDAAGRKVDNRSKALYGPTYKVDGVFGPRSVYVEGRLSAVVKAAR